MVVLLSSWLQLHHHLRSSLVEVLQEGVVSSGLKLKFSEVVVFVVEHVRPPFLPSTIVCCPLRETFQLLTLSQPLPQLPIFFLKCSDFSILSLHLSLKILLMVHYILHHQFEGLLPLQQLLLPQLHILKCVLAMLIGRFNPVRESLQQKGLSSGFYGDIEDILLCPLNYFLQLLLCLLLGLLPGSVGYLREGLHHFRQLLDELEAGSVVLWPCEAELFAEWASQCLDLHSFPLLALLHVFNALAADTVPICADAVDTQPDGFFLFEVEEVRADEALQAVELSIWIDRTQQFLAVFRKIIVQVHKYFITAS